MSPWRERLESVASEEALAETWARVQQSRNRAARRGRWVWRGAAFATAAALALLLAMPWRTMAPEPAALSMKDGRPLPRHIDAPLSLDDASRVVPRERAALQVLENGPERFALHLLRGGARFEVTPGGPRRWRVEAAGVSVEVVGTVFEVTRSARALRVFVERGSVLVRGPGVPEGVVRLDAGRALRVALSAPAVRSDADAPAPPAETPPLRPSASQPRDTGNEDVKPPRPARSRQPRPAAPPAQEPDTATDGPAALMSRADERRRQGDHAEAMRLLNTIVRDHPDAPEAPLAALTRAHLLADQGRVDAARDSYRRARSLGLPPVLDSEAAGALRRLDAAPPPR